MSDKPLHARLRSIAVRVTRNDDRGDVLRAAAEIEGHNEAFEAVIEKKQHAEGTLSNCQANLRHTHEFISRWRELLVAMQQEYPDDIRIKRALAGEHPMRPAPWEKVK
jgi:hypothetical protein